MNVHYLCSNCTFKQLVAILNNIRIDILYYFYRYHLLFTVCQTLGQLLCGHHLFNPHNHLPS